MRKMKNGKLSQKQMKKLMEKCYIADQAILNLAQQQRSWKQIIEHRDWQNLKQLILTGCNIDDKGLQTVTSLQWPSLQNLVLDQNNITSVGVRQLVKNNWQKVKSLIISFNNIQTQGMQTLLKSKSFPSLTQLFITQTGLIDKGMYLMPDSSIFNNLKTLHLNFNELGSRGVKFLIKVEMLSLATLEIWESMLGDEGVKYLSKARWPNIQYINMDYNDAFTDGFTYFSRNDWRKLNGLRVSGVNSIDQLTFLIAVWNRNCAIVYEIDGQETNIYSREAWSLKYDQQ